MILSTKQTQGMAKESRLVVDRREGTGSGVDGQFGFLDTNCSAWNGWALGPTVPQRELGVTVSFSVQQKLKKHYNSAKIKKKELGKKKKIKLTTDITFMDWGVGWLK